MTTIAKLFVALGLDANEYHRGLGDAESAAQKSTGAIGKTLGGLSAVGGAALKTGALAAGAAVAGLGGAIASTIGPASDLSETANKITVVFGEAANGVNDFAANAGLSLGQTKQQALDAAATFGVFGKAAGLSGGELGDFSTNLVGLSSDLASFYNTSPEQAIQALGAALRGESEPIRAYGVLLDDASLRQKALEMGLVETTKNALTPQQKVLASYQLILAQTSDAQGDFARTSDGLANQQRITTAQFENLRTTIGTAFLPVVQKLSQTLNEALGNPKIQEAILKITNGLADFATQAIEYLPRVIDWIQRAFGWLTENQGVIVAALAAIGVAIAAFVYTTVVPAAIATISATWPILLVMAAIAAVVWLLYEAWTNNWGGMRDTLLSWWAQLQPTFETVRNWLAVNIPIAIEALKSAWVAMQPIIEVVVTALGAVMRIWWTILDFVFNSIKNQITSVIAVVRLLKDAWDSDFLGIRTTLQTTWANIQEIFSLIKALCTGDWAQVGESAKTIWDNTWAAIGKRFETTRGGLVDSIRGMGAQIANLDWLGIGYNIIRGIINGMMNAIGTLIDAGTEVGQSIIDTFSSFFKISSPSGLMADAIGEMLPPGIVLGAQRAMPGAMLELQGALAPVIPAMSEAGASGGIPAGQGQTINFYYQPFLTTQDQERAAYILDPILEIRDRRRAR